VRGATVSSRGIPDLFPRNLPPQHDSHIPGVNQIEKAAAKVAL
jgi:hypothetical protein